jgi:hypothetical protein
VTSVQKNEARIPAPRVFQVNEENYLPFAFGFAADFAGAAAFGAAFAAGFAAGAAAGFFAAMVFAPSNFVVDNFYRKPDSVRKTNAAPAFPQVIGANLRIRDFFASCKMTRFWRDGLGL